ncbi:hypothetical protein HDU96_006832 [Phlyctochytrium bullatum]|nr:hypothetical protein HDU96_006832 [Phlyctochytrium bullatum]
MSNPTNATLLGLRPFTNLPSNHPLQNATVLDVKTHVQEVLQASLSLQQLKKDLISQEDGGKGWLARGVYLVADEVPFPWAEQKEDESLNRILSEAYADSGVFASVDVKALEEFLDSGNASDFEAKDAGRNARKENKEKTSMDVLNQIKTDLGKEKGKYKRMLDVLAEYDQGRLSPLVAFIACIHNLSGHEQLVIDFVQFLDPEATLPPLKKPPSTGEATSYLLTSYKEWAESPLAKKASIPPRQKPPPITTSVKTRRGARAAGGPASATEIQKSDTVAQDGPASAPPTETAALPTAEATTEDGAANNPAPETTKAAKTHPPTIAFNTRKSRRSQKEAQQDADEESGASGSASTQDSNTSTKETTPAPAAEAKVEKPSEKDEAVEDDVKKETSEKTKEEPSATRSRGRSRKKVASEEPEAMDVDEQEEKPKANQKGGPKTPKSAAKRKAEAKEKPAPKRGKSESKPNAVAAEELPPATPKCYDSMDYIINSLINHIAASPFIKPCSKKCGLDLSVLEERVTARSYTSPVLFRRDFEAMVACREQVERLSCEKLKVYFVNVWDHFFPALVGDRRSRRRGQ